MNPAKLLKVYKKIVCPVKYLKKKNKIRSNILFNHTSRNFTLHIRRRKTTNIRIHISPECRIIIQIILYTRRITKLIL